jgi:outer membrane protein OmpA-like peptidoglycan-associated protein
MKWFKVVVIFYFSVLSFQAMGEEDILLFEEPPTEKEILESFGEPVVKTRGDKKTRVMHRLDSVTPASDTSAPVSTPPNQNTASKQPTNESSVKQNAPASSKPPQKHKTPVAFPLVFALGSAELSKDAQKYVDSMALALKKKPDLVVHISGHTDASGSDEINKSLSLKRAESVRNYLELAHQIDGTRLEISGDGSNSLFDFKNPYAAINRRVQFERK